MQNISYHGNELHHTLLLISLQMINTSKLSLLNYVLYVPLAPRALVPYVLSCLTWLVLFVRSWPTWLVSYAISCSTCLMLYILSCPTCLVLCVLPCITCLVPYVASCLALCEPFFLTYPIVSYLAYSFPNINSCTLEFPCTTLVFFYSFATCSFFGGNLFKLKQIFFADITLNWRSVFINSMIYSNYLKRNAKTYIYETANYFATNEGEFKARYNNHKKSFGT